MVNCSSSSPPLSTPTQPPIRLYQRSRTTVLAENIILQPLHMVMASCTQTHCSLPASSLHREASFRTPETPPASTSQAVDMLHFPDTPSTSLFPPLLSAPPRAKSSFPSAVASTLVPSGNSQFVPPRNSPSSSSSQVCTTPRKARRTIERSQFKAVLLLDGHGRETEIREKKSLSKDALFVSNHARFWSTR